MKKLLISSIAMLMMLIITSCIHSTDPYAGLVKKNNSYYLMIGEKAIPVDSGITYKDAKSAYSHERELHFVGEQTQKKDWMTNRTCDLYALYDGEKIVAIIGKGSLQLTFISGFLCILAIVCMFMGYFYSPFWLLKIFKNKQLN